ncbi:urease accessory protein UreF [Williamsia sp. DF01-3]|uniref:urease accessory protein UreF n=1 Tax=Williamsia sp. DF01-3 TaxID=2934157 RepID=UPI001FF2143B|nr:urease accessory UreF family protein [Williamsia sp. DF01-3]MCK0518926.1 urease accessory protein UreF [Williamsia sp. DF01-3]
MTAISTGEAAPPLGGSAAKNLAMLLTLADSRLPVGAHVHSGGLEEAITSGVVRDVPSLRAFLIRRVRTTGLVAASITAAVVDRRLEVSAADVQADARTPSAAARSASRSQGRGMLRLGKKVWPHHDWTEHSARPHLPVVTGSVARAAGLDGYQSALVLIYTTMTGSATAGQRLLALDPGDVALLGVQMTELCEETAAIACTELADYSDPLLDVFAQRHELRAMPLFAS